MVGTSIYDHLPADLARFRKQVIDDALATGQSRWFSDRRSGRWYENRIVPIGGDGQRRALAAIYARDITERRRLELAHRSQCGELETVISHVPVAVLLLDDDGRVRWGNQRAAEMAGTTAVALVGSSPGKIVHCLNRLDDERGCGHGDDCARCPLRLGARAAVESGRPTRRVEASFVRDPGRVSERRHLIADFVPSTMSGQMGLLVYLQDVTELRDTEQDLELKGLALDQIADRVTMTDVDGNVIYVNDAVCRMFGRRREQILGTNIQEFGEDLVRGGTPNAILSDTAERGCWRGEVVNFTPEGREVVLDCRTQRIHDDRGEVVAYCGVSTDITERKRQEERLRESERRFRRLHEQLPIGYFCLDADGYYVDTNPAWQEIVQSTREGLHRRHFCGHVTAHHEMRFCKALDFIVDGQSQQVELKVRRRDGTAVTVFCVGRAVLDEDEGNHVSHWVAVDVSERRNLEEQLRQSQKMDALGRLAAGVAHDFNNQITVIRGYCDMLLEMAEVGPETHHALDQILRASERATATTSHLLAFSRQRAFEPRETDLNSVLQDLHHPVTRMIGERIRVRIEASPRLPAVMVDQSGLQQAVLNLIINARDALPSGGEIVLRTSRARNRPGERMADEVSLAVIDNGIGIDPDLLDRVREPFFTTKQAGEGTGLGLSMVSGFVEQCGGRCEITSDLGRGTTVSLILPAATAVASPAADPDTGKKPRALQGRVLVAEDADEVRRVVGEVLREHDLEVVAVASPGEAVEIAARQPQPFDLLLADLVMPDMNGEDLAELLLARGQVRRVLFMSGYLGSQEPPRLGTLVEKPFTTAELVRSVDEVLKQETGPRIERPAHGGVR